MIPKLHRRRRIGPGLDGRKPRCFSGAHATQPSGEPMGTQETLAERAEIDALIEGRTVGDLLLENAERHGEEPAVSWKEGGAWRSLSWREYHDRVAEAAMGLRSLGVGRGDFVAIMAKNRPEHLIADLGALHAGATP